jgi:hypothetical protein
MLVHSRFLLRIKRVLRLVLLLWCSPEIEAPQAARRYSWYKPPKTGAAKIGPSAVSHANESGTYWWSPW